jgi:hypothetical protein
MLFSFFCILRAQRKTRISAGVGGSLDRQHLDFGIDQFCGDPVRDSVDVEVRRRVFPAA